MKKSLLGRLSPRGGKKQFEAERERLEGEKEKAAKQLRDRVEENAIMQEVCQDIGGQLAGTVNIMEALQDEIELRTTQAERDRVRMRQLEAALEREGKAGLLREKEALVAKLELLEAKNAAQGEEPAPVLEAKDLQGSAASHHKAKAESLSQALMPREKGSEGHDASKAEADLRQATAEKEILAQRLHEVEEKLLEMNVSCQSLRAELAESREVAKKYEAQTQQIQEDLASLQEELRVSGLEGNAFLRESADLKEKMEQAYRNKGAALDMAAESQVKEAERRALGAEAKAEELESVVERQGVDLDLLRTGLGEKQKTIVMLKVRPRPPPPPSTAFAKSSLLSLNRHSISPLEGLDYKECWLELTNISLFCPNERRRVSLTWSRRCRR